MVVERSSCELPLIDFARLNPHCPEREECMKEIVEAARQWGFFQVVNHGISQELLESLQFELMKVFHRSFHAKTQENFLNLPAKSYRWGNPSAINLRQLSWSEAFHISFPDISKMEKHKSLRSKIEAFATTAAHLAETLGEILAQKLNIKSGDSSFLTILYQDQVGGLQLLKDGKWVDVKPNPQAVIVNIGDIFQALSNGVYKSIKHRVVAADKVERFSVAYFYCPSDDAVIQSNGIPLVYRKFTFREYKQQTEKDVKETGDKVGLSRFLS
ncbi:hypothetical protein L6164_022479 [Bauhinia variegata]|uniref:Uncharacterized protein n=1 Tax=Bauhinia variegata TaxID=167791 RepID=A0ACB9MFS4_BAUVA|nr:hypothetical protein L6164_022479 [Bauhinia variegata]